MSSRCTSCGGETAVKDSRPTAGGRGVIRRRRVCLKCRHRFTTLEFSAEDLERLISSRVAKRLTQVRNVVRVVNDAMNGVPERGELGITRVFTPELVEEIETLEREERKVIADDRLDPSRKQMRGDPTTDTL